MRRTEGSLTLMLAVAASACAGAPHQVGQETLSPEWNGARYERVLVIGVYEDRAFRAGAETAFAEELRGRGIEAEPSYDRVPDLMALDSEDEIGEILSAGGFDAVLSVATLDPGYDFGYEDALETRGMVYLLGGRPGRFTDLGNFIAWAGSGIYTLHLGLWDASSQKPVWQVTTDSESTGSESEDLRALADFCVVTLRDKGML